MTRIWPLPCEGLGNSSYLAEVADGLALAVDPGRDPRPYRGLAAAHGLRVAFTADTHVHADFVSGGRELAAAGARLLAPAGSGLSFPHEELRGGEDLDLGGLMLRPLATPGHTPEHLSYLLLEGTRPVAVFTGGALIVGGVARTDLAFPDRAEGWTRAAYRSAQALLGLPSGLAAYPTHGPGSFCSAGETGEHLTTIGRERDGNPLLAGNGEDTFTRQVLERLGSYPAYFARLPAVNRRGAPRHGTSRPVLAALTPAHVAELAAGGATVIDARPIAEFAAAHIPGSLSDELRPAFATWLGWLASPDRPLIVVLDPARTAGNWSRPLCWWVMTTSPGNWTAAWTHGRPPGCPRRASRCWTLRQITSPTGARCWMSASAASGRRGTCLAPFTLSSALSAVPQPGCRRDRSRSCAGTGSGP